MVVLIQLLINTKEVLKSAFSGYGPQISVISLLYPPKSSPAVTLWGSEPVHTKSWFLLIPIPNSWTKDGSTACLHSTSQPAWQWAGVRVKRPSGPLPNGTGWEEASAPLQVICRALAAVSASTRTAWLVLTFSLRQLLVGHRCLWEGSTQNSTQPQVSPGTQTSTWHPGYL